MSATYHIPQPHHPRALYETQVDLASHPPAKPIHPDPYSSRSVLPDPSTARYPAAGLQSYQQSKPTAHHHYHNLPEPVQPAVRPSAVPPIRTGSVSSVSLASYRSQGQSSQTVSPTRSSSSQMAQNTRTADLLTNSGTYLPSIICSNTTVAESAANLTCLFWFESVEVIQAALNYNGQSANVPPLSPLATPDIAFKRWVSNILNTTQVTQNVVVVALLFIYRLKVRNQQVRGRPGSEYRLFTVGLMLGNKFLDDNTYTNRTWADVSHLQVTDIHVMEVEFLSNMRYQLLVTAEAWDQWLVEMGRIIRYCAAATENGRLMAAAQAFATPTESAIPSPLSEDQAPGTLPPIAPAPASSPFSNVMSSSSHPMSSQASNSLPMPSQASNSAVSHQSLNSAHAMSSQSSHSAHSISQMAMAAQPMLSNSAQLSQVPNPSHSMSSIPHPMSSQPSSSGLSLSQMAIAAQNLCQISNPTQSIPPTATHSQMSALVQNMSQISTSTQPVPTSRARLPLLSPTMRIRSPPRALGRKRSLESDDEDDEDEEDVNRPSKRVARSMQMMAQYRPQQLPPPTQPYPYSMMPTQQYPYQAQYHGQQSARMAMPQRIQPLEPAYVPTGAPSNALVYASQHASQQSLHPLQNTRAMSTVYHSGAITAPQQQLSIPGTTSALAPAPLYAPHDATVGFSTPTRRQSPSELVSRSQYPMPTYHAPASHSSNTHSPIYLQNRASPYGPIRSVDVLLHPSFSGSLPQYPLTQLEPSQMHYRSVARRNDVRTGVVPDFASGMPPSMPFSRP